MDEIKSYLTVGRRKEAVARVRILSGKGKILVNGMPYENYFVRETDRIIIQQPFSLTNLLDKYDIVTSGDTEKAFETKKADTIKVFTKE